MPETLRKGPVDRISELVDKYGVQKTLIILAMAIAVAVVGQQLGLIPIGEGGEGGGAAATNCCEPGTGGCADGPNLTKAQCDAVEGDYHPGDVCEGDPPVCG